MRHNSILKNILLFILCLALGCGLGYMVYVYRNEESERSQALKVEAEKAREAELETRAEEQREKQLAAQAESSSAEASVSSSSAAESVSAASESDTDSGETDKKTGSSSSEAEASSTDTEAESSTASSAAEESTSSSEKTSSEKSSSEKSSSEKSSSESSSSEEPEEARALVISCRGDAFQEMDDADKATGYPAKLQALLDDAEIEGEVADYTWDMAGSLSQVRLAGVEQAVIDDFIDAHVKKAEEDGVTLRATETQIRIDFDRKDTSRDDEQAIPVICMGFYGGFGQNLDELTEQQQLILDTYDLPKNADGEDEFVIMGFYPSGWTDTEAYDKAMEEAWGDHYLGLNGRISVGAVSDEGRQAIAEALFDKLKELEYIG